MSADFDLPQVEAGLADTIFAGRIHHLAVTGSTNTLALEAAAAGAAAGVWVADEQTAGRGRGGHAWHSAAGDGLYVSWLVRPRLPMQGAARITLAAGLAAQAAIAEATGLRIDIRWPNDLMLGGRKCGGILVESGLETGGERLRYAVVGVGINVDHAEFPPELAGTATSLAIEAGSGRRFGRERLLVELGRALLDELERLELDPVAELLARFARASTWVTGMRVRVGEGDGYTGWTCGLDPEGFLLVRDDADEVRTVLSGGVRPA